MINKINHDALPNWQCRQLYTFLTDDNLSRVMVKKRITLATIEMLWQGLLDLCYSEHTETISEQARDIYLSLGFIVESRGIGWAIRA